MKEKFKNVFIEGKEILTKSKYPKFRVYGEKILYKDNVEYRVWDPERSKLAAAIIKGLKFFNLDENSNVLYLGASSGTTVSHISDIVNLVFAVEISKRMMRNLLKVCEIRKNIVPILDDANYPENYYERTLNIDFIYQDVAQPNQVEIFNKNFEVFKAKYGMLAIKARSIDVTKNPSKIFKQSINQLKNFEILESINLMPFHKDHILINVKYKG